MDASEAASDAIIFFEKKENKVEAIRPPVNASVKFDTLPPEKTTSGAEPKTGLFLTRHHL
jgi:hypothetical protein